MKKIYAHKGYEIDNQYAIKGIIDVIKAMRELGDNQEADRMNKELFDTVRKMIGTSNVLGCVFDEEFDEVIIVEFDYLSTAHNHFEMFKDEDGIYIKIE